MDRKTPEGVIYFRGQTSATTGENMPKGYLEIPDWFAFENQGGNVATTDLNGNGQQDVVVTVLRRRTRRTNL